MKLKHLKNKTVFIIGGPTASGKSKLAMDLAQQFRGEIVNGDSMQVYRNFKILTSHPSSQDMQKIKHHLYNYVFTNSNFNAVEWLKNAIYIIEGIISRNKTPIVVGGSGLYLEFLLKGVNKLPDISFKTKKKAQEILNKMRKKEVFDLVKKIDPTYALKINIADNFRITKVLEIFLETNKNITYFHSKKRNLHDFNFYKILNLPNKKKVNQNIHNRLDLMIHEGLINEIREHRSLVQNCNIEKAIGYKEIISYLDGIISLDEAKKLILKNTKNFAKRQYTWFKNRFYEDIKLESNFESSLIVETFLKIN